jgi:purine-binding chemotaxis protein CheW
MAQDIAIKENEGLGGLLDKETDDFVTFTVSGQLFGIPVLQVSDILTIEKIAAVPLAPLQVKGSINLRGRIVTVIDVRTSLGIPLNPESGNGASKKMGVTVEQGNDLYTLLVDQIGEVVSVASEQREPVPQTIDPKWKGVALSVYRLEEKLMIVLDPDQLITIPPN